MTSRFPFAPNTLLAPMEGVSHPAFRRMMTDRPGLGLVCTEFVRVSRGPLSAAALRREVVKVSGVPLSVQVMGNDADKMAEAASVMAEAGADVVDVNLGCPMPRVVRKGVGAAMLKDPKLLFEVLSSMRKATPGLLSAKIRAGFDEAENVTTIAKAVEDSGVDFIAVHPRRRCDFYTGVADWRIIGLLREVVSIPVVGNGDVWYAADALRMERETGCDAVMIGRPAIRNPWIFEQIAALRAGETPFAPSGDDILAHLEDVRARYAEEYGDPERAIRGKLKEKAKYLLRGVPGSEAWDREALRKESVNEIFDVLANHLEGVPASALDLDAVGAHRLEKSGSALLQADAA